MPSKSDFRLRQKVVFGTANGEKTEGVILKLNPKKAKVQTTEARGRGGRTAPGTIWSVPYSLMKSAEVDVKREQDKGRALAKVMSVLTPYEMEILGL